MASGLPIVTTRMPALVEVLVDGENGVYVPERDPVALAAALKKLAADRQLRQRMGERSLERIRTGFDIQVTSGHVAQVLGA
jgi:glycosyltransferase involved in cell wall biosynthesis